MYICFAVLGSQDSSYSWHCSEQRWNNTGCTSLNYIGVLQVNVHQYMPHINFACIVCLSIVFYIPVCIILLYIPVEHSVL